MENFIMLKEKMAREENNYDLNSIFLKDA